jgi:HEAT repeat protein
VNCVRVLMCLVLACAGSASSFAQESSDIHSPRHKAWDLLVMAILSKRASERTNGVRALGLLRDSKDARDLAESKLKDSSPDVRKAAATALGQMHATQSIPKLEEALADSKIPEGIGYIPFAGIGWDAYRTMNKKNPNKRERRRQGCWRTIRTRPPAKRWLKPQRTKTGLCGLLVEAIAQRGDPSLLPHVVDKFRDKNPNVRYGAAAAVIRLSEIEQSKSARNDR